MDSEIIRTGTVCSTNPDAGTVKVVFADRSGSVSAELPMLRSIYRMPEIGETVLCLFLTNNPARGFCLGTYFSPDNPPPAPGDGILYMDLFGAGFVKYDNATQTLTLHAPHVTIEQEGG